MRKFITIIIFGFFQLVVFGQDREIEWNFERKKADLKENGIKSINQFESKRMLVESSEMRLAYRFLVDTLGNLSSVIKFHWKDSVPINSISYKRNNQGEYNEKTYKYYDSTGTLTKKSEWLFTYDNSGNKTLEVLISASGDTSLINRLEYDKYGNLIKQTRGYFVWTFKYNQQNQTVERREWYLKSDSLICTKLIRLNYNSQSQLETEFEHNPRNEKDIWNSRYYTYSKNIIESVYEIQAIWTTINNEEKEKNFLAFKSDYHYYENGELELISKTMISSIKSTSKTYYQYEYYD